MVPSPRPELPEGTTETAAPLPSRALENPEIPPTSRVTRQASIRTHRYLVSLRLTNVPYVGLIDTR